MGVGSRKVWEGVQGCARRHISEAWGVREAQGGCAGMRLPWKRLPQSRPCFLRGADISRRAWGNLAWQEEGHRAWEQGWHLVIS